MTKSDLIRALCANEGKKVEVSIGNMRECVSELETLIAEDCVASGLAKFYVDPSMEVLTAMSKGINQKMKKLLGSSKKKK
jgi:hypothetical protein